MNGGGGDTQISSVMRFAMLKVKETIRENQLRPLKAHKYREIVRNTNRLNLTAYFSKDFNSLSKNSRNRSYPSQVDFSMTRRQRASRSTQNIPYPTRKVSIFFDLTYP